MKTTLESVHNRSDDTEELICDQKGRIVEITQLEN